jgi:beta-N-acetylhexosaminidase
MMDRIGQLFIIGFSGRKPSDDFLELCSSENIGGIILFEENCSPHKNAEDTITEIASLTRDIPFIAVDQEGGRVCRFRGAPAEYPAAGEFGSTYGVELYDEQFSRAAHYLRSLGVNLLLGPVADLGFKHTNQCLKGRTFGDNPARVIAFIERSIRIAKKVGLLSCLKHFPGLGASSDDPHQKMASADYDLQTFLNREALTFKAGIGAGADMVMTTHLLLPKIDARPVTESKVVLNLLLREKLEFDGVIITDDLLMKGYEGTGHYGEKALQAFNAGHDILLFGSDHEAAREAITYFREAYGKGLIENDRLAASLERISGIKSKLSTSVVL